MRSVAVASSVVVLLAGLLPVENSRASAATATTPILATTVPGHPETDYMGSSVPRFERVGKAGRSAASMNAVAPDGLPGLDVSHYQNTVNWPAVAAKGAKFAYMKATESTTYRDPTFAANYAGSANAGLKRGAYHFGLPDKASGGDQARFFLANGGGWVGDGKTLPPVLDIEYNPYSTADWAGWCYNRTPEQVTAWLTDFVTTVHDAVGRWPVIYTTRGWWNHCTGSNTTIPANSPLWISPVASDAGGPPGMPAGWTAYTFYQWAKSGTFPGDQDVFAGTIAQLAAFAAGS
ncbi:hydrolase [Amycolatopsis azurea DSM 43854]|uniref:Hydrolase n=1 Tax=Amycolatopsis azurea DSM 43854 TaxID=1238180 RepID=A0ABX3JH22_9PSEU|nr:hydrolase [Amycolatopsis azurea DSM 43854]